MNWSLDWAGGALGLFAAALAAAAFAWHARRSRGGRLLLALRALAALVLALAALRPTVAVREVKRVKPRLLVLLDAGHAMQGRSAKTTRLEAAVAFLTRRRPEIEAGAEVSFYALDDHGRRLAGWEGLKDLKSSEAGFHPAEALRDVADAAQEPAERAWLLTDGNAETDRDLERSLAALRMPVDVIGVGPARRGRGVSFSELKTPDFAFLHGRFAIEASVEASGAAGETLDLTLLREQKGAGLEPVGRQSLSIRSDFETASASFTASAQTLGAERYRLEVRGLSGALLHSRDFRVEVIRQKYRIMYLAGRPSAEYANLREFLKSDPNHELVSFVILRNPDNPSFVADQELSLIPFPAEEIFVQSLNQFDLFILENFSYARFNLPPSYLASLRSFVSGGGALLVIGGENAFSVGGYRGTPLEEMLPVVLSGQVPDFIPGLFRAKPVAAAHLLLRLYDTAEASAAAPGGAAALDGFAQFLSVREGATVLPPTRPSGPCPRPCRCWPCATTAGAVLGQLDSTWRWRLGAADDFKTAVLCAVLTRRAVSDGQPRPLQGEVRPSSRPSRLARARALLAARLRRILPPGGLRVDAGLGPFDAARRQGRRGGLARDRAGRVRRRADRPQDRRPRPAGLGALPGQALGLGPSPLRLGSLAGRRPDGPPLAQARRRCLGRHGARPGRGRRERALGAAFTRQKLV